MDDRQRRIPGFDQAALGNLRVGVIGAGGLGGEFIRGSVKKGIGTVIVYDDDDAAGSNLNRQLLTPDDIGKNKALCAARNAAGMGWLGTELVAVPMTIQAAVDEGLEQPCDVVFCGPDNDETRAYVARHYLDRPVVFAALSRDAGRGYVAVQEPGKACFGCFRPAAAEGPAAAPPPEERSRCPATPAVIDVTGAVAMLGLYALDSVVMARPGNWNFKQIVLDGLSADVTAELPKRPDCPICGG